MVQIPVYVFTGFLDSGKTKFIQETLEDERFNAGERTLLLVFEEGEEEYDFSTYPHKNVFLEVLDQQTVTTKELAALEDQLGFEAVLCCKYQDAAKNAGEVELKTVYEGYAVRHKQNYDTLLNFLK